MLLALAALFGSARLAAAPVPHQDASSVKKHMLDVSLAIEGLYATTTHTVLQGTTALDLLTTTTKVNGIDMATQEYSGMGTLVEKIGSLKNGTDGKYWMYYVNDAFAPVGADAYKLVSGDSIEWRFEVPKTE